MRIYATEENGTKHLIVMECDSCDARIKPYSNIAESGWEKWGTYHGPGDDRNIEILLCPECSSKTR